MQDILKQAVANHVQTIILGTNWNYVVEPVGDRVNDASKVSALTTMVRIYTPSGRRFFEVIVKERY